MKTNAEGLALIKSHEGCRLKAYQDVKGVWTIGWGHTGTGVKEGLQWTQKDADDALLRDLNNVEAAVTKALGSGLGAVSVTPNQFSALVSFAYNVGNEAFRKGTLLRMVLTGQPKAAADEFPRWNRSGGKVVAGLTNRRLDEAALFSKA